MRRERGDWITDNKQPASLQLLLSCIHTHSHTHVHPYYVSGINILCVSFFLLYLFASPFTLLLLHKHSLSLPPSLFLCFHHMSPPLISLPLYVCVCVSVCVCVCVCVCV